MLFRNTLAQSAGTFAELLVSFLLAPIMIARLGLDQFGVWAVTGAFAAYAGLLDLDIGLSLQRFIAVSDTDRDERRIRECVGLGLTTVTVVGVVALAAAAAGASFLSDTLGVLSTEKMRYVLMSSVAIWTLNSYRDVLNSVGIGKRRMEPPNVARVIGASLNFALSVTALLVSSSLVVYALASASAALLAIIPAFFAMRCLWNAPYIAAPSYTLVKEVLTFGVKSQISGFADLVNFETDKVVIALMIDVRSAAVYEIASRVVMAARSAAILSISAMIPTGAAIIAAKGRRVLHELYPRYLLRSCALAFPLFMLISVGAPFLLVAWLGNAPGDSAMLVSFLTLAYLVNITTGAGSTLALGAGHPGMVSTNSLLTAALNVALTVALAPLFGLWGVATGTFLALLLGTFRFTGRILKLFELPLRDFLAGVLPTGALAIGLALPPALLAIVVGIPDGRGTAAVLLAVVVAIYGLPYWVLATRRGYLPDKLRFPLSRRSDSIKGAA